jgi:hypothetical protein
MRASTKANTFESKVKAAAAKNLPASEEIEAAIKTDQGNHFLCTTPKQMLTLVSFSTDNCSPHHNASTRTQVDDLRKP